MNYKNAKYHIQIDSLLLFNLNAKLKQTFPIWVYIYLKLKYNIFLQRKKEKVFNIDANTIAMFFDINRATVFDSINLLINIGLLTNIKRGYYKLNSEREVIDTIKELMQKDGVDVPNDSFIPIYLNFFVNFFNDGGFPKELWIYYYLISKNKHFAIEKEYLEINVNQKQVCQDLRMDHRTFKQCITKLVERGLVKKDEFGVLLTKFHKPLKKKRTIEGNKEFNQPHNLSNNNDILSNGLFLGWYKSKDGKSKTEILKSTKFGIVLGSSTVADGVPPTNEEILIQEHLRKYGMVPERPVSEE